MAAYYITPKERAIKLVGDLKSKDNAKYLVECIKTLIWEMSGDFIETYKYQYNFKYWCNVIDEIESL